jgi:hypothetical protein
LMGIVKLGRTDCHNRVFNGPDARKDSALGASSPLMPVKWHVRYGVF